MLRRFWMPFAAAALMAPFVSTDADASVSIAISFDQLVKDADSVAVITPGDANSVWEDNRIFTYTKVHVDQGVAGELTAGNVAVVRTMGGVVGDIGQQVDGEAVLIKDKPSVLFLRKYKTGAWEVSARGQGQYPVVIDPNTKARTMIRSQQAGVILPPKPATVPASGVQTQSVAPNPNAPAATATVKLAHEILHNRTIDDGAKEIATAWKRLHPTPATTPAAPSTQTNK